MIRYGRIYPIVAYFLSKLRYPLKEYIRRAGEWKSVAYREKERTGIFCLHRSLVLFWGRNERAAQKGEHEHVWPTGKSQRVQELRDSSV